MDEAKKIGSLEIRFLHSNRFRLWHYFFHFFSIRHLPTSWTFFFVIFFFTFFLHQIYISHFILRCLFFSFAFNSNFTAQHYFFSSFSSSPWFILNKATWRMISRLIIRLHSRKDFFNLLLSLSLFTFFRAMPFSFTLKLIRKITETRKMYLRTG